MSCVSHGVILKRVKKEDAAKVKALTQMQMIGKKKKKIRIQRWMLSGTLMLIYHQHEGKHVPSWDGYSTKRMGLRRWHGRPGTVLPKHSLPQLSPCWERPPRHSSGHCWESCSTKWWLLNTGIEIIVDLSTQVNAISITRPFSRSP